MNLVDRTQTIGRSQVIGRFAPLDLDTEAKEYLEFNASRYVRLLEIAAAYRKKLGPEPKRIMDVGPSFLTKLLHDAFPDDSIFALGMDHELSRGGHWPAALALEGVAFHGYDLRQAHDPATWPELPPVDLVLFSEVLEHLYVSPRQVLAFLRSLLAPGGFLLLTTPNAATLPKRLRFALLGKNPIPLFRDNGENPGHYREYSQEELFAVGGQAGFTVAGAWIYNDSYALEREKYHTPKGRLIRALSYFAPAGMRENHYVLFRNPP